MSISEEVWLNFFLLFGRISIVCCWRRWWWGWVVSAIIRKSVPLKFLLNIIFTFLSWNSSSILFLLFWVGPQRELGAMPQWHWLVLKLSRQPKTGSEKYNLAFEIFFSTKAKALLTWGWPCVHCPVQEHSPLAQTISTGGPRSLQLGGRTTPSGENGVSTSGDNKGWWQQRPVSSRLCPQCGCWKAGCQGWGETGYWWLWKQQQQDLEANFVLAAAFTWKENYYWDLKCWGPGVHWDVLAWSISSGQHHLSVTLIISYQSFISFLSSSKCVSWLSWQLS